MENEDQKSDLKFTYFPLYGRGDAIRGCLFMGNVKFEDTVMEFKDWPAAMATFPDGGIPCLEVNGVKIGQSLDILRFAGKRAGYYPTNVYQAFKVDSLMDTYSDCRAKLAGPFFARPAAHEAMFKEIFETAIPKFLDKIDQRCSEGEFLVGNTLTIADFYIGGLYTNYLANPNGTFAMDKRAAILEKYPNFKAYGERYAEATKAW